MIITPEELEALDPKKTRTIDIEDFVDLDEIDPLYYEHPYYLVPDTGAAKAYRLLLDALRDTNKVAIARVVLRSKEYLTAIRPAGEVLTMETMLFADELVPSDRLDELPDDDTRATDRELAMARQLIESQATEFDPSKYRDEYRERVLDLIERKAQGEDISVQPDVEEPDRGAGPDGRARGKPRRRRRQQARGDERRLVEGEEARREEAGGEEARREEGGREEARGAREAAEGRLPLLASSAPAPSAARAAHATSRRAAGRRRHAGRHELSPRARVVSGFSPARHRAALWRIHRHMGMGGDQLIASLCDEETDGRSGTRSAQPRRTSTWS